MCPSERHLTPPHLTTGAFTSCRPTARYPVDPNSARRLLPLLASPFRTMPHLARPRFTVSHFDVVRCLCCNACRHRIIPSLHHRPVTCSNVLSLPRIGICITTFASPHAFALLGLILQCLGLHCCALQHLVLICITLHHRTLPHYRRLTEQHPHLASP